MIKTFTLSLCLLCSSLLFSQRYSKSSMEVGVLVGATNYIGDLTESRMQFMKPAGGIFLRYNPYERFSIRGNLMMGTISGDDKDAEAAYRKTRNLHFKSFLMEFSGQLEISLFRFDPVGGDRSGGKGFTPYIFGGVGVFTFNPKAEYNGEWVELQPLGTEGQNTTALNERKKYALTQVSFPLGGGIKFRLMPRIAVGLEYGIRFTNTDYLDDISLTYVDPNYLRAQNGQAAADLSNRSQPFEDKGPYDLFTKSGQKRGDNVERDYYAFTGLTISYALGLRRTKCFTF